MARAFRSDQARAVIEEFRKLSDQIDSMGQRAREYESNLAKEIEAALIRTVNEAIDSEPVEVLINNHAPEGLIASLRMNGVSTLGDYAGRINQSIGIAPDARSSFCDTRKRYESMLGQHKQIVLDPDNHTPATDSVVLYVYKLISARVKYNIANKAKETYCQYVDRAIEDLRPGTGALKWLFASSESKEAATNAYLYLQSVLSSGYRDMVRDAWDGFRKVGISSLADAWSGYKSNPNGYIAVINAITPGWAVTPDTLVRDFPHEDAIAKARSLSASVSSLFSVKERISGGAYTAEIEKNAAALANQEAYRLLTEIPVEELNRGKKGIRVTALANAGFKTIADVFGASTYELESVKGISEDGAFTIKRECRRLADQAMSGVKIRLSTDSKSKEASSLVL